MNERAHLSSLVHDVVRRRTAVVKSSGLTISSGKRNGDIFIVSKLKINVMISDTIEWTFEMELSEARKSKLREVAPTEWLDRWDGTPVIDEGTHICTECGGPMIDAGIQNRPDEQYLFFDGLSCGHGGTIVCDRSTGKITEVTGHVDPDSPMPSDLYIVYDKG